ncbi:MAG TPA: FmdB family zinc ribbon protein [Gemmatimonadales bacterium]|jgi:putative FmdB family regulatory protein
MPTYDYKCPKCGKEFQQVQKITAKAGAKCPRCGSKAERQLSGGAGLVFKGSGFYLTDYGRSGQTPRKSESSESSSGEKSTSEKPAEKPAEKAAPKPKSKKKEE